MASRRKVNEFGEAFWTSADGKRTKIKDLEIGHLVNILNWVAIKENKYPAHFVSDLTAHAYDIKFKLFSESKPFPHLADNGKWVLMDPKDGTCKVERPPAEYTEAVLELAKHRPGMKRLQTLVSRWK